jgi:hypothetical protein
MPFSCYTNQVGAMELLWKYDKTDNVDECKYKMFPITSIVIKYNTKKYTYTDEIRLYHPIDIDVSIFTYLTCIDILGLHINTLVMPDNVDTVTINNSIIADLKIPPRLLYLSLYESPGVYNNISTSMDTIQTIIISGDEIDNFRIPNDCNFIRIYKCKINKISNEYHHIYKSFLDNYLPMIFIFEDVQSPYVLAYTQTSLDGSFTYVQNTYTTLKKLYIIQKTNNEIDKIHNTYISIRLRNNVFIQDTHITNTMMIPETDVSSIYKVMRLGSNYPKRWLEFII